MLYLCVNNRWVQHAPKTASTLCQSCMFASEPLSRWSSQPLCWLHNKNQPVCCQWKHNKQARTTCEQYSLELKMQYWIIITKNGSSSLPKFSRSLHSHCNPGEFVTSCRPKWAAAIKALPAGPTTRQLCLITNQRKKRDGAPGRHQHCSGLLW